MDSEYYYVFDSYDHSLKTLPLSHRICYAKRIVLYKVDPNAIPNSFLEILKGMLKLLRDFYEYTKKNMGMVGGLIQDVFSKRID